MRHAIGTPERDQHVEAEIVEHHLEGLVKRGSHIHNHDKHHAAEHQREHCQRDTGLAPESVAQAERQRARQPANPPHQPVEPVAPKPGPQAVVADSLVRRDARATDHRHQRRQQGHDQSHRDLNGHCSRHQAERAGGDVKYIEQHTPQQVGGESPRRHSQKQGEQAINQRHCQVDPHHAPPGRADHLHHTDLPHLLRDGGVHHVDDQESAQYQRQHAQHRQNEAHCVYDLLCTVDFRIGDSIPTYPQVHTLQPVLDPLAGRVCTIFTERLQANVEPVEALPPTGQPGERLRRDEKDRVAQRRDDGLGMARDTFDRHLPLVPLELHENRRAQGNVKVTRRRPLHRHRVPGTRIARPFTI